MASKPGAQREVEIEQDDEFEDQVQDRKEAVVDEDDAARKSREAVFGKDDAADDEFEREDDARLAYDEDAGEMRDKGERESRRQRRNRARREARRVDEQLIASQNERIQRLEAALTDMGRAQLGLHAGGIDAQIAEAQGHIQQIDDAYAQAVIDQDKGRMTRALRLRDEARERLMALGLERRRVEAAAAVQSQAPVRPPERVEVDPQAARYSETFMDRHPWFDPNDNTDEDSQLVKAIDDTLVNEGYKPNTARYWRELERRVEARGLGKDRDDMRDDYGVDDEDYDDRRGRDRRSDRRERTGGLPPRSQRGGSGVKREKYDERRLPPMARDTLDQLGLLDKAGLSEEQLKERQYYIDTWRKGLKNAAEQRSR